MTGPRFDDEPEHCGCCGTSSDDIAVDDSTELCLYCQPCPLCGRMGTSCQPEHGDNACDTVEYPGQPRRDFNEVMTEIAAALRAERSKTVANGPLPHTTPT